MSWPAFEHVVRLGLDRRVDFLAIFFSTLLRSLPPRSASGILACGWIPLAVLQLVLVSHRHVCSLRVQRLAWTIADLAGHDVPGRDELDIALAIRRGEQPGAVRRQAV
jgi:hypothetical protein